jgi:hypothetical protein
MTRNDTFLLSTFFPSHHSRLRDDRMIGPGLDRRGLERRNHQNLEMPRVSPGPLRPGTSSSRRSAQPFPHRSNDPGHLLGLSRGWAATTASCLACQCFQIRTSPTRIGPHSWCLRHTLFRVALNLSHSADGTSNSPIPPFFSNCTISFLPMLHFLVHYCFFHVLPLRSISW